MAGSLNKAILIGRLGQDPKLSYMPSGQAVTEFSLATDESYKDREGNKVEKTEWHRIKVYGKSAEFCANYLGKGRQVYVEGQIRTRKWQDKEGQDRYTTEIVVSAPGHTVTFLDSKSSAGGGGGGGDYQGGGAPRGGQRQGGGHQQAPQEDYGPAFPSEASGMDDVPF